MCRSSNFGIKMYHLVSRPCIQDTLVFRISQYSHLISCDIIDNIQQWKDTTIDIIWQPWVSLFQMQKLPVANTQVSPMLHYDKEFYVVRWPIAPIFWIHVHTESSPTILLHIQLEFWVGNKLKVNDDFLFLL